MKITLDALTVLESIQRNGSFAAAANELHRVRSALTYTVQKLESSLGIVLFDRTEHRAKLTPLGEVLLREGNALLKKASDIERTIKRLNTGWEEKIFIAVDDIISIEKLYPLIAEFYEACPYTQLTLSAEILNGCWDALISDKADLAVGVSGDVPPDSAYGIMPLGVIKFVFAVAPAHPLAKLPEPLKNSDIINYRAIVAADTSRVLPARSSGTLQGQEVLTVPSIYTKRQAQIAGLGVGYLPLHLIQDALLKKALIVKQVEKPKPCAQFAVAWRLNQTGKATEWFLEKFKQPETHQLFI